MNFIWEAWLDFDTHWHDEEIIVNEVRGKTETDWANMMRQAMVECYRVLRPGRWLSLCYHDTSEGTWALVQDIMAEVGFVADKSDTALFIGTEQKSYNQVTADKVTKRDLVINFRKPRPKEVLSKVAITGDENEITFNDKVRAIIRDYLAGHPGATKDRVYDEVVSHMVRAGRMEAHNFDELLRQVAEEVREPLRKNLFEYEDPDFFGTHEISRWHLRETESGAEESEQAVEESAANRIEQFLIQGTTKELRKSQLQWDELNSKEAEQRKVLEVLQDDDPDRKRPQILRELREIESALKELGAKRAEWEQHAFHYTEIYEFYLLLIPKPKISLFELLEDYFFLTDQGNWRPPASEGERQEKVRPRNQATHRKIQRFCHLIASGETIPHTLQPDSATLIEWIRHCKRSGLYEQGKLLYEKGGVNFDNLSEEGMVSVEEDYQVCLVC